MRFNCQKCSAKYQIADEKVANKMVRMKCRKCDELIQVKAELGPTGVAAIHVPPGARRSKLPKPAEPAGARRAPAAPAPSGAKLAPRPGPPRPSGPSRPGVPRRGTGLPQQVSGPGAEVAPPPASQPSRPGVAVPDVSAELDDDATAVMMRPDLDQLQRSKPLPAAGRPAAPSPGAPAAGAPAAGAPAAGASAPGAPAAGASAAEAEVEWWIGIEGEPVGPIEVDYVRRQLASGKATPTSLVWREEMTDWQPLNTVDELWSSLSDVAGTMAPAAEVSDPLALERLKDTDAAGSSGPGVSKPEPPAAAAAPAKAPAESPDHLLCLRKRA